MITQIPVEVLGVLFALVEWEDQHVPPIDISFATFRGEDIETKVMMMSRIAFALKYKNPPNIETNLNDWCSFILNEFVEYGADIGIPNIKSIIKVPDTVIIADDAAQFITENSYNIVPDDNRVREIFNGMLVGHYGIPPA